MAAFSNQRRGDMMKTGVMQPLSLPVPTDGLQHYLQRIQAFPLLSEAEESDLAKRYREEGDLMAAQRLVVSHLRYVVRIARMYSGYGLALADLIQEGTIGLMKAVKRFDPKLGVRLVSFAVHWIKSEIHEFIIRNWRIVKVATTKAQRKLFFNLRKAKKRLGWFSSEEVQQVAQDLGVSPKEVVEMESRLNAQDAAFDAPLGQEETIIAPEQYLEAEGGVSAMVEEDWAGQMQAHLQEALYALDERSRDIVSQRLLTVPKTSLRELAEKYQISIERVRQLEVLAMAKLKTWVLEKATA